MPEIIKTTNSFKTDTDSVIKEYNDQGKTLSYENQCEIFAIASAINQLKKDNNFKVTLKNVFENAFKTYAFNPHSGKVLMLPFRNEYIKETFDFLNEELGIPNKVLFQPVHVEDKDFLYKTIKKLESTDSSLILHVLMDPKQFKTKSKISNIFRKSREHKSKLIGDGHATCITKDKDQKYFVNDINGEFKIDREELLSLLSGNILKVGQKCVCLNSEINSIYVSKLNDNNS